MELSDRRRALMAGGGKDAWNPAFGIYVYMTEYYQSGAILDKYNIYVFVDFPTEDLTGTDSKYVIVYSQDSYGGNYISIVPRENRKDADISDKRIMMKVQYSDGLQSEMNEINVMMGGTFNFMGTDYDAIINISENNSYRTSYYFTGNQAPNMQNDFFFDYYLNSGSGTSDECPMGGSHDFSAIGQPGSSLPGYQCPSCGQTGYCYQQTTQCTKCGESSDVVRCQYCGWQT